MARLSLEERLNRIEDKISEKSFRENKGLGNEVGYYVFDYDPRAELEVRNHIAYLKDRINNGNKDFKIIEFDLFHTMIQVLEEEGYLEAFFDLEKENGFFDMADSLVETLGLDETNELNLIISKILQEDLTDSVVFLTGVGISEGFARHHLIGKGKIKSIYQSWVNNQNNKINRIINLEEYINSEFISLYSLEEDIPSNVSNSDITLYPTDETYNIKTLISYAVGCMFGRYSLNKDGLICAGENIKDIYWKCQGYSPVDDTDIPFNGYAGISLAEYNYGYLRDNVDWENSTRLSYTVDYDNVIPITDEEYFSDDIVGRFVEFVRTVYGTDTLEENLDFIANALGSKGDTSREIIRNYFLKDFYFDHLKIYQKRPIYWLFDSGKQNGFKALIYMHRYDVDTVGRVRTDYLHRAQKYVETAMQSAQYTIDNASSASEKSKATKAVTKYTKQLAEMKIYDEAIAHIANKRIEIDLDDGVKVNYEKFQGVEVAQEGKKALKVDLLAKIK